MTLGIRLERRHVDDRQVGDEVREIFHRRTDQQVADEKRVPSVFGEDARLHAKRGIRARVEILCEEGLPLGVGEEVGEQGVEILDRHRGVVLPPDDRIGVGVPDDELVLRAAAGVDACVSSKGSVRRDMRLMAAQGVLVEVRRVEVPVHSL